MYRRSVALQIALPPSLVLVVFLPPLIFAAAQDTSWAEIRREAGLDLLRLRDRI